MDKVNVAQQLKNLENGGSRPRRDVRKLLLELVSLDCQQPPLSPKTPYDDHSHLVTDLAKHNQDHKRSLQPAGTTPTKNTFNFPKVELLSEDKPKPRECCLPTVPRLPAHKTRELRKYMLRGEGQSNASFASP